MSDDCLAVLETEMRRLVRVWEGITAVDVPSPDASVDAVEILEDVWNTLGTAHGLSPPQLREGWQRIIAAAFVDG